jgi:hypothetical protein
MGVIDKTTYILSCKNCQEEETASVLDKGSNWGGSHWQSGTVFKKFKTNWNGGGVVEPYLLCATCISCGSVAEVQKG